MMADKKELDINGAQHSVKKANAALHPSDMTIKGVTYTISMMSLSPMTDTVSTPMMTTYHVSASQHSDNTRSFMDHGTNGDITGEDCPVIEATNQFVNVEDIDNHVMAKHPTVTAGGITNSNRGLIILIMNQYAHSEKGTSIHSLPQMEWCNITVDNKLVKVGEIQCLTMHDDFVMATPENVMWSTWHASLYWSGMGRPSTWSSHTKDVAPCSWYYANKGGM